MTFIQIHRTRIHPTAGAVHECVCGVCDGAKFIATSICKFCETTGIQFWTQSDIDENFVDFRDQVSVSLNAVLWDQASPERAWEWRAICAR